MLSAFGWGALAVQGAHLALCFLGGAVAARAAGRSIWLFGAARGRDAPAAFAPPWA